MQTVSVGLKDRAYTIYIGAGILADLGTHLKDHLDPAKVIVVTNPTVRDLYGERLTTAVTSKGMACSVIDVPDGEKYKSLESASRLYGRLVGECATRKDPIIAVGGGVIGDLAGFVAATYMRGVPLVHVPTTLVAQADSSIGGKTAVDIKQGKNLVGAFHQPAFVLTDTNSLKTLPDREFNQGMAEVIKTVFLESEERVSFLEDNRDRIKGRDTDVMSDLVAGAATYKAGIVERDERDTQDVRAVLNYGHTLAHAIEALGSFSKYPHGEAVAIGMMCAAVMSERLAGLDGETTRRQRELLHDSGLPTELPAGLGVDDVVKAMRSDKKRVAEKLTFILLEDIGKPVVLEVDDSTVKNVLKEM